MLLEAQRSLSMVSALVASRKSTVEKWTWPVPALPCSQRENTQVCERGAGLGLQGGNRVTLLLFLQHGCESGTNWTWLSHLDESLVNQGLEKTVSLPSADLYGSQRVKHLPGSVSNLVSLVQASCNPTISAAGHSPATTGMEIFSSISCKRQRTGCSLTVERLGFIIPIILHPHLGMQV